MAGRLNNKGWGIQKIYEPSEAPTNLELLPGYVYDELRELSDILRDVLDSYTPDINTGLAQPLAPLTISTTPADIADYQVFLQSAYAGYAGFIVDNLAGTIFAPGDGDGQGYFDFICTIFLTIDVSGFPQNNYIYVDLNIDGVNERIGDGYRAEIAQDTLTISTSVVFRVNEGSTLKLQVSGSAAGSIAITKGQWTLEITDIIDKSVI